MRGRFRPFLLFAWLLCLPAAIQAAVPPVTPYNPKPAEGDLLLPLPDGAEIAFRVVTVPGKGLWGNSARIVQVGDAGGSVFDGVQRTLVGGSFPGAGGEGWTILIGKYELTKGQYVALMGLDALVEASGDPEDAGIAGLEGRAGREALMAPLAWVGHAAIEGFIHRYNRWLFDPANPERRRGLPQINGIPGFVRLPSEEEWEFAARGGGPAIAAGNFDDRLPFPIGELNNRAWHLGNAKNRVRPIGLREPNPLGLHDLYGNLHEMTAGLFRPELTQGRPGGVPVRGASVSTPPNEVRASIRTELDAWAWDPETKGMVERRAFNIGARLAIGSNVVVDSAMRKALEEEYAAYRQGLRKETPAGRSLDNLMRQATSQIDTVEPILQGLLDRYPDEQSALLGIRSYLDSARQRLDQAQRESARSLLQDALRNGTNLSVLITKQGHLAETLESARKLVEISSRYQAQVNAVEQSIAENHTDAQGQYLAYLEKIRGLGDYGPSYVDEAATTIGERQLSARERRVLELALVQQKGFNERRAVDQEGWRAAFEETFKSFVEPR